MTTMVVVVIMIIILTMMKHRHVLAIRGERAKLHKIKRDGGQIAQPRYQTLIMKNQAGNIAIMRF